MDLHFENATVIYEPDFLSRDESQTLFTLISTLFEQGERKLIDTETSSYRLNRKTMVFIDSDIDKSIIPKIWGNNVKILAFPPELLAIKQKLETQLSFKFNICLANYYNSGKNSIGWHSDNEEKGSTSCIASISLGQEREFLFKKKGTNETYKSLLLHHGSLIVMGDGCQENYQHSLPVDKSVKEPRLNLTFRLFDPDRYKNY